VSDDGLARLRACESNGRYDVVSSSGAYRGAYQFHRSTWNSIASRHYPELAGVDPAAAMPFDQDRMARALWAEQGRSPWPHCGKRV
jgi:resuscitation-promoting factor RpfB